MKTWAAWLALGFTLVAQEKSVAELEAEKRDPKKRAETLLTGAAGLTASVKPETMVAALMHIGDNYQAIDRKKAIEYLRQAFTNTASLADHPSKGARSQAQAAIISQMTALDVGEAVTMLQQMEPPAKGFDQRTAAAGKIIDALVKEKSFDPALNVVDSLAGSGSFPYRAAQRLFKAMPPEDARRLGLFASATSAYAANQNNQYGDFLVDAWDALPIDMAQSALDTFVKQIVGLKEENTFTTTTLSGSKGAVHFDNRADAELFKVMYLVQRVDAKKAKELLDARPALRSAIEQFPEGPKSMEVQSTSVSSSSSRPNPGDDGQSRLRALSQTRGAAAMKAMSESPAKALSMVADIPSPEVKAQTLGAIARSVADKDPVTAGAALSKCIALLDDLKDPVVRSDVWAEVATAAHQIHDDALAQKAIERALADAGELLKKDANEDSPNEAQREYWPSTQAYRKAMIAAAKVLGVDGEPLLEQIKDPDLRLIAQVEFAQALLGRPHTDWSTSVSRSKK